MVALELFQPQLIETEIVWVDPVYKHRPKKVQPGRPIENDELALKWYELIEVDSEVDERGSSEARAFLDWVWDGQRAAGFAIHHPCADGAYLVASRWEDNNELWEQVWWRPGGSGSFSATGLREGMQHSHCLWQLAIVSHEAAAWVRYLESDRSPVAFEAWLSDTEAGFTL